MHPNLSFEQAPPISVPLRFFLTAPLFAAAAGLLLAGLGATALTSRWDHGTLALTHLLTVGFMLQVMCGALLQFVPVTTGTNVWWPRLVASILHPLLIVAALALVAAFLLNLSELFRVAAPLFATAITGFLGVVGAAVLRTPAKGMSIWTLRLALLGLVIAVTLGVLLAAALGWQGLWQLSWSMLTIANVHAAWGLGGWALLLVMGVSYLVVPMFQLTPSYPSMLSRLLPTALFVVIGVWSIHVLATTVVVNPWRDGVAILALLVAAGYASVTLWLQVKRRRRVTDTTFAFWRGAMLALLGLAFSWLGLAVFPQLGDDPRGPLWLGVLALVGVFMSVINGMLYKIVPFLIWLHLQRLGGLKQLPPNIKQMIPERAMRRQLGLHFVALGLLLAAVCWPSLARLAGLVLATSVLWLEWNLISAVRIYQDFQSRLLTDRTRADA